MILSADPERTVTVPLVLTTNQGGASPTPIIPAHWSASALTFDAGETEKTIVFTATQDSEDDDEESVRLTIGSPLPDQVDLGGNDETTVTIRDCESGGIWCSHAEVRRFDR